MLLARRVRVHGDSMHPLLEPGDRVLFDRLAYRWESPRRGDLVLVERPAEPAGNLIKLIAGLPSEQIAVALDRLWVDGQLVAFPGPMVGSLPGRWTLGTDEYFVLSYAVAVGQDSRQFGPVGRAAITARAWMVYAPSARRRRLAGIELPLESPAGRAR